MGMYIGGAIAVVILLLLVALLSMWRKAPQDKAIVVTGRKKRVITGGGGLVLPVIERIDVISLENMIIEVGTEKALTENGVDINVDGVTVLKVKSDETSIYTAMEQFNTGKEDMTIQKIKHTAKDVLEGKLREIISKLTVEEIYKDRERFAAEVQGVAAADLAEMGIEIKSFTLKDINDDNEYLVSLGKKRIAEVKRDATIAEAQAKAEMDIRTAEAERDSRIQTAAATQQARQAEIGAETEIAQYEKEKSLKVQSYRSEQETAKAKADLSYQIEENREKRSVVETELAVESVRKDKQIDLAEKDAIRREKELEATIKKDADASLYREMKEADAKRYQDIARAEAEAESIKRQGLAEAEAIRVKGNAEAEAIKAKGMAEAEAMKEKAEAFKQYNEAAVIQMLVEKLPDIAESMAAPLTQTEKIVIVDNGGSEGKGGAAKVTGYVTDMVSQLPETVNALTGIDLVDTLKGFAGGKSDAGTVEVPADIVNQIAGALQGQGTSDDL